MNITELLISAFQRGYQTREESYEKVLGEFRREISAYGSNEALAYVEGQSVSTIGGESITITHLEDNLIKGSDGIQRYATGAWQGFPTRSFVYTPKILARTYITPVLNLTAIEGSSPVHPHYLAALAVAYSVKDIWVPQEHRRLLQTLRVYNMRLASLKFDADQRFLALCARAQECA